MGNLHKVVTAIPHFFKLLGNVVHSKEIGFSFNLSDRCPVGCDCYWRAMNRVEELSDQQVLEFFEARRLEGKLLATIVGGEPYVRPNLLKEVTKIMPANWVVTSATTPLLILPKTTHFISIDGEDAETHDKVRKMPGLYNRIVRNLTVIRSQGEFPAYIHCVLNKLNYSQIESILQVWLNNGLVDGVMFSTTTPITDGNDDWLLLTHDQRVCIVDELLKQKKRFKKFLCMTPGMIRQFHPDYTKNQTPETCPTARFVASYDAHGDRIGKCIFSEKGDCSQCGCVITPTVDTLVKFPPKLDTISLLSRLYTP